MRVGIIGFGNMGATFAVAFQSKQRQVYVYDIDKKKTAGQKGFIISESSRALIEKVEVVVLAIKPQDIKIFLNTIKDAFYKSKPLLITIAAGVSTKFFEKHIKGIRVVRAMPNLAAKVGQSMSFICKGKFAKEEDLAIAKDLLSSVGEVVTISQDYIDKVTSIAGSGPGYIYYFMDCLYKGALSLGFSKGLAKKMVIQTFLGAAALVKEEPLDFKEWVGKVASKGGTTQAALRLWQRNNLPVLVEEGIEAALLKAKKLNLK
ncbi:MAG: pyrroline-5-carboxylate reductase [Candidatus Omnitrophota bacterium]|nr:MAG: pyrroline-5-carboxylate reductase [Candidatus Omnitrophota bacterium]